MTDDYLPAEVRIGYEPSAEAPNGMLHAGQLTWCKASQTLFVGEDDGTVSPTCPCSGQWGYDQTSPVKTWYLVTR